jgi:Protein of unknown function (DUF1360)
VHPGLLLVTLGLAGYRLTRLVTTDTFPPIQAAREWVEARGPGWLGKLVTCSWCASAYVTAALVVGIELCSRQPVPVPAVFWLAVWAVAALVAWAEGRLELDPNAKTLPAVVHLTQTGWATGGNDDAPTVRIGATRLED